MAAAAFGFVGLEISAALVYTGLVKTGLLSLTDMAKRMSTKPAAILGLTDRGVVQVGKRADLTIFDPAAVYRIDPREFASKGRNTPFAGREVSGRVVTTLVDGQIVYQRQ